MGDDKDIGRVVLEGPVKVRMEQKKGRKGPRPPRYYIMFEIDPVLYQTVMDMVDEEDVGRVLHHYFKRSGKITCEVRYDKNRKKD